MASTESTDGRDGQPQWRLANEFYYSRNFYCRKTFGCRVRRVSVDAGFGCPNRDEKLGTGGCIFCDPESFSPSRRLGALSITQQIDEGLRLLRTGRRSNDRFLAYFQPATNTYAPVKRLRELYLEAIDHPDVIGLVIGTRPDCVPNAVLDLLAELSKRTWLLLEYGLQTIHEPTLRWLGRGHTYAAFLDAHRRSRRRGLQIGGHVILGLPGESRDDMRATARELARLGVDAVKLHNLHAVCKTRLADMVAAKEVRLPTMEEYVGYAVDFLEELTPDCVIDRLSGDAPVKYFVGPAWCLNKSAVRAAIEAEFRRRGTWQGSKHADRAAATPPYPRRRRTT